MTYQIVTVSDRRPQQNYYCYDEFFKSLKKYDIEPIVLSNEKMGAKFNGLGTKPNWQCRAIKEGIITAKYTFFVDCWDLFFAEHPDKAFEKYLMFNSPIVFNAEKNCFPHFVKEKYDALLPEPEKVPYRYLNSGVIIGETEAILTALEAMGAPNIEQDHVRPDGTKCEPNDQQMWLELFLTQQTLNPTIVKMVLDYNQDICQTLHDVSIDELEIYEKEIQNKYSGCYPSIFHANGNGKSSGVKEPLLKHLQLR